MADSKKFDGEAFPIDFFWGGSTSSHQVEGGTNNQWTVWELEVASERAKHAEQRLGHLANWEEIKAQATDPANYVSADGVDHFRRYKEDFDILEQLQLNSFRFGIEWARIEPEEGLWDDEAIDHYKRYIAELKQRGITPFMNIWHWTMPTWFTDKGGFSKRSNIAYFERFVEEIAPLAKECGWVFTLNEPNVYASFSYATGEWPPQQKSLIRTMEVYFNLVAAHKRAYRVLKAHDPAIQVGIAAQLSNGQPKRVGNMLDTLVYKIVEYGWNWWFLNRIEAYQDFVGFNYYFTDYYSGLKKDNPKTPVNDLGWYMEPGGVYHVIMRCWQRYKKPVIIAENGVADQADQYRAWWLHETMLAMEKALGEGAELIGYFHWSLLDNFEWAYGWWPKFGLVEVERQDGMRRKIRPSALRWAKQLKKIRKV
jgi:beta-glucosidase